MADTYSALLGADARSFVARLIKPSDEAEAARAFCGTACAAVMGRAAEQLSKIAATDPEAAR